MLSLLTGCSIASTARRKLISLFTSYVMVVEASKYGLREAWA